jgi:hypothetical protein
MFSRSEKPLVVLLLSFVIVIQAAGLLPELSISTHDLNDNVFHFALIDRVVKTVESGGNPLDCWSPEWGFGFPVLRVYQPLAHLLVAAAYFALWKTVPLMTVFVWFRFLTIALLPASFFAAGRWFGLSPWAALASALLAPLISTNSLYGVEYGSYLWAGTGLFPQAVATHLLVLGVALGYRALRDGRRILAAGILVGLSLSCQVVYGYLAAISVLVSAILPSPVPLPVRLRRLLGMGAAAFAASAYQVIPLLSDSPFINHSRWEPVWKWDSFGATTVLAQLAKGELLDYGRIPVLTGLAFAGAALVWWNRRRGRSDPAAEYFGAAAAVWLLMYFGRPFWGSLLTAVGVLGDMHLHRVLGGAHVFLVLLAGTALAALWTAVSRRSVAAAVALTAVLLYPVVRERRQYLIKNAEWGDQNLAAQEREGADLEAGIAQAKARPGRVYAGLSGGWGGSFRVGYVPVYAKLATEHVPAVGFLYHSMGLPGDLMVRFDETRPDHYRVFGIGTVIAPADGRPSTASAPVGRFGRFEVRAAPGPSYFDLVDAPFAVKVNKRTFYDVNDRWLQSPWPGRQAHLLLDWGGSGEMSLPRLDPAAPLPAPPSAENAGEVLEERDGEIYRAEVNARRPAFVLFKMTWHPAWTARVDGVARPVVMLSPGFSAVAVDPGRHRVEFSYEPGWGKTVLAAAGALILLTAGRRGVGASVSAKAIRLAGVAERHARRLLPAAITVALCLPVCLPLLTSSLILGHDSYSYFPRLVEMHRNVASGVLLPRWAPDLGSGHGQPLFLFHPPLFYWIGEVWQLLGVGAVTATNLAAAAVVVAAGFASFYLGRLYFGDWGGHIATAAYLYAPYFAVDVYVRSSLEEFTALALFPLALYGFGAFARGGRFRHWAVGGSAFGALLYCHFPAALLFAPLLAVFCVMTAWREGSWRVLAGQAAGVVAALGIGAASWFPALAEKQYVAMDRVLHGSIQYSRHFVLPGQLLSGFWGYGESVPGGADGMSFSLGWGQVAAAALAWIWLSRRTKVAHGEFARFFGAAAIVLCMLMLEDSAKVWERLPLLPYVEMPWRMLGPAAICLAVAAAALGPLIAGMRRRRGLALAGVFAALIVPNLTHFRAGRTTEIDLAFYTPLELARRGFETTTTGELTPRWMTAIPPYQTAAATVSSGDAEVRDVGRTPFSWTGEVKARSDARVRTSFAWFPGWTVRLDGREIDAGPAPGSGLIEFAAPPGDHRVEVAFGRSPARQAGEMVTVAAILALAAASRLWRRGDLAAPVHACTAPFPSSQ